MRLCFGSSTLLCLKIRNTIFCVLQQSQQKLEIFSTSLKFVFLYTCLSISHVITRFVLLYPSWKGLAWLVVLEKTIGFFSYVGASQLARVVPGYPTSDSRFLFREVSYFVTYSLIIYYEIFMVCFGYKPYKLGSSGIIEL